MKIAFLVLATQNHSPFKCMAAWFKNYDCHFFVHVDAKFSSDHFERIKSEHSHVTLIRDRTSISWGGFSMIMAEVALMKEASQFGDFDRFILISDDTLPIRIPERIIRELSNSKEMIGAGITKDPGILCRYNQFYMNDFAPFSPRHRHVSERGISLSDLPRLLNFSAMVARGKKPIDDLHYGSQWWCLTSRAVKHFLLSFDQDEHLRTSFEFSAIPDEHYIQTVIATSPDIAQHITLPAMYVDFGKTPKPYVLTSADDLEGPLQSSKLFARKFSSDCEQLLETIRSDPRSR